MNHTNQRMQTYWAQTKDFIRENWTKFNETDLEQINGDYDKFFTRYNEYYNDFPAGEAKIRDLLKRFYNKLDDEPFQKK